ncbi:MAG TPA: 7-carboxy-7-deazaguanine synthase [Gemmatimonadales bacterium]|nr:7-carboxy-7-deazaguanine synthase [Gemmatimonadales bacterium]
MSYAVKEIYATLQSEGYHTGRPAVFLRFAGCNLWSGLEADRAAAVCRFCDTDFVGLDGPGGGRYDAGALARRVKHVWDEEIGTAFGPFVVITGGEPLLQLDEPLAAALHAAGFSIAIETNGTLPAPEGLDWICVSPKAGAPLVLTAGNELKLVYPQTDAPPEQFEALAFRHFYLQPMDGPDRERHTDAAVAYCAAHPLWKLSLQTHKLLGIP